MRGFVLPFYLLEYFLGLETLRGMFLFFNWNSPKKGSKACKSQWSWNHECFEKLAVYWSAECLPLFVILMTLHRVSIWVDAESDYSYFLNKAILLLLLKVSQHFNFYKLFSLLCQTSVFKHGIVIVHFKGEMLFSSIVTLRNVGEAILLFASNITSLALIIVLLVRSAVRCVLTSWRQLALPSMPRFSPANEKNYIFMAFCYG